MCKEADEEDVERGSSEIWVDAGMFVEIVNGGMLFDSEHRKNVSGLVFLPQKIYIAPPTHRTSRQMCNRKDKHVISIPDRK